MSLVKNIYPHASNVVFSAEVRVKVSPELMAGYNNNELGLVSPTFYWFDCHLVVTCKGGNVKDNL